MVIVCYTESTKKPCVSMLCGHRRWVHFGRLKAGQNASGSPTDQKVRSSNLLGRAKKSLETTRFQGFLLFKVHFLHLGKNRKTRKQRDVTMTRLYLPQPSHSSRSLDRKYFSPLSRVPFSLFQHSGQNSAMCLTSL